MARLAFLGSPGPAAVSLQALIDAGHDVGLVVSGSDTRRGRGSGTTPTPVKQKAIELGLEVTDRLADVAEAGVELGIVVAYGRIIPAAMLEQVPMLNVHFSLLPRWRGAAPVERAILAGDEETGVCIMRLEAGLDTGPVLRVERTPIEPGEHASHLLERLAILGAEALVDVMRPLLTGDLSLLGPGIAQVGEPRYAEKIGPDLGRVDWSQPTAAIERLVQIDRAWTTFDGQRLRILDVHPPPETGPPETGPPETGPPETGPPDPGTLSLGEKAAPVIATGDGALILDAVQPPGKKPMDGAAWLRGLRTPPGRLGD